MHRTCSPVLYLKNIIIFVFDPIFVLDSFLKLRVAKGQPASSVAPQHSVYETALLASDWNDFSQSTALSNAVERPVAETAGSFRPRR
ncbi:hypothetical protein ABKV19_003743 [Rosa sericea]